MGNEQGGQEVEAGGMNWTEKLVLKLYFRENSQQNANYLINSRMRKIPGKHSLYKFNFFNFLRDISKRPL